MNLSALWGRRNNTSRRLLDSLAFLEHEPLDAYRAQESEHFSAEQLNDFRKDPFVFRKRQTGLLPKEKAYDQHVDRAVLILALEGRQEYERQFVSGGPLKPRTNEPFSIYSTEYRDWAESQDRAVLTPDEATQVEHIECGIRMHAEARKLLADGVAEGVVRGEYRGVSCQSRTDWINPNLGLVGLVIGDSLSWLESTLRYSDIINRLAFEHGLISELADADLPVHIISTEKRAPHRCGVWFVSDRLVQKVRKKNEQALDRFRRCRAEDDWPTGYEKLRVLNPVSF
jgi:hypothetical protein